MELFFIALLSTCGLIILYAIFNVIMTFDVPYLWWMKHIRKEHIIRAYNGQYHFSDPFRTVYRGPKNTYWCDKYSIGKIEFLDEKTLYHCGKYEYEFEN